MSQTAHTQGPWRVERNGLNIRIYENETLVTVLNPKHKPVRNAQLIAAAPELLEALKDANALILAPAEDLKQAVLDRVRAAISKAEGRQP